MKSVTDWKALLRMRSPGKLFATVLFRHLKMATAGGLQKGISDIDNRLTGNNLATITPTDHPLPFNGWWALLGWAIVLTFISARGYFKTLGLICFTAIVLAFVLPIAGFSGSWGVLATLLCFATPFWLSPSLLPPLAKRFGIRCAVPTDRHITKEVTRPLAFFIIVVIFLFILF